MRSRPSRPDGVGIGLRPAHFARVLETLPKVAWFEAISDNYFALDGGLAARPFRFLEQVREHYPVALHGVSLSIGAADPLDERYLSDLRELARRIEPWAVSDHLCWSGVGGTHLHDLLPLPFTAESLRHVEPRVRQVQDFLDRVLVIENVSSYVSFAVSEMTEWEFLTELSRRTGCELLLDVNNVHVTCHNHAFDSREFIRGIAPERVAYFHLAGHSKQGKRLIDTHDQPVAPEVWNLYAEVTRRFGDQPALIEWDGQLPSLETLVDEAERARQVREEALRA